MKIAVLSESEADEAAVKVLAEGVLSKLTQQEILPLRSRGWPSVLQSLPAMFKHLYYRTDVEALAVVVDSDESPIHNAAHDEDKTDPSCRMCRLRAVIADVQSSLNIMPERSMIKTAVGLAVPAVEAWYLCGINPHVNEAAWARRLESEQVAFSKKSLKREIYGTERPSLRMEADVATEAAHRLITDLELIERLFPGGFGALAHDLRSW